MYANSTYAMCAYVLVYLSLNCGFQSLLASQRPQSAAAQLTDTYGAEEPEAKDRSDTALSLPAIREHSGNLEGADGAALSKSVDDMLLATGGSTEVEERTVSSKTAGLETLLSQVEEFGCAQASKHTYMDTVTHTYITACSFTQLCSGIGYTVRVVTHFACSVCTLYSWPL